MSLWSRVPGFRISGLSSAANTHGISYQRALNEINELDVSAVIEPLRGERSIRVIADILTMIPRATLREFENGLGPWVIRHRWSIIVITLITVVVSALGALRLTVDHDIRVFFSEKNPQLEYLEALEDIYTKRNNVFFIVAPRDENVFTKECLTLIRQLTDRAWQTPYSNRVDSLTNFQHTRAESDDLIVEDLVSDELSLSRFDLLRIRDTALAEPLLVNRLVSPHGHVTGVNVNVLLSGRSHSEVAEVAAFARQLSAELHAAYPDVDLYLTGTLMTGNAFGEASEQDMRMLTPLMLGVLVIIMSLTLRNLSGTLITMVIILMSVATGMGIAGWFGISINPASSGAPTIILTLAVADSIHVLATMSQTMRLGKTKYAAISESLSVNFEPIVLTSITTVIGFLSMNFSDVPPFRDLGNIVAIGVMAALIYSILFLPAFMAVVSVRTKGMTAAEHQPECDRLASLVIRLAKPILWSMAIVFVLLACGIAKIELNDDWLRNFDEKSEIRIATDFLEENLTGGRIIEYSLSSGEPGGINSPEYLQKLEAFSDWYRAQPDVIHVASFTEIVKRLNMNMHADDESFYRLPANRELAAQYLLVYEMSLPFGLDLNNQINVDKSATRVLVTVRDMSTRELRQMDERAQMWLNANAPASMISSGSGLSLVWAHLSGRNIISMLIASFGALLLISALLIIFLRSWHLGILSILPNLAPAIIAFGLWGHFVGQVGLGLSVIVSMTLGIVVDDTVHFLSKYLRGRLEYGFDAVAAVRYSFNTIGTAMWVTTMVLVAGFLVLTLSGYKITADMGLLSAVTILLALAMDFLLLPHILMKLDYDNALVK